MVWTQTRSKIATAKRRDPDADVTALRRQLRAERLEEHIKRTVDASPPLTAEECERLAALLRPIPGRSDVHPDGHQIKPAAGGGGDHA